MLAAALSLQLATVLVFTTTDCPISNRYAPEIKRLAARFEGSAGFILVYPVPADSQDDIVAHIKKFGYEKFTTTRDDKQEMVRKTGVTVTPEVVVLAGGKIMYRGRIDDRYIAFGKDRPEPTVRDLERSLEAILAGKPVPVPQTQAIGCILSDLVK